ncbi:NAD(P)/FAD-dependent oxidoreductase [Kingella negevensis]|uniref:NAD(P)/FAD-dependent oxidoreductase n=1 Tax=Kingella negevensis TaxID=1522312 RepID=UPI001FD85DF9|nr:FAD-dependent oxidoreductase [Kingella negevensis]MDK4687714.1 FAD-dependent oxidoreductase [Kingella negevensis]WII91291.1 FAD-dependent oxidoreductase [Kingella negevensis]WII92863.1 FAD-dependent oxidoreductase [Kingella negevensis]
MMHYDTIIVGGGAGGVELAAKLGRKYGRGVGNEKVLLIDRSIVHIWKPTLHEVAVGTLDPQQEGLLYTTLARHNHFSFTLGELTGFNAEARQITIGELRDEDGSLLVPESTISFNTCVLAIGSGSNSFGTKGFEHAHTLENAQDAQQFQKYLFGRFLQASHSDKRNLNIAIIGAGATGVELAAEMTEAYNEIHQIIGMANRFRIEINLIEAAPRILSVMPEQVSEQSMQILERKQINVHVGTKVNEITEHSVVTDKGEIPADIVIWAAGIKASESNKHFGLETNHINQFIVDGKMATSAKHVYAIGDCSSLTQADGTRIPATAQAAHQQASFMAKQLWAMAQEKPFNDTFVYTDSGSLVSLGFDSGVGKVATNPKHSSNTIFIKGLIAKWAHVSLHLLHHFTVLGFRRTLLLALARLAQKRISGRLKLH